MSDINALNEGAIEALFNDTIYLIEELGNITVIISQTMEFEGSADYTFLANVLNAVKLNMSKINIININNRSFTPPKEGVFLLFGVNAFEAGFKDVATAKYEIVEKDNLKLLEADKLNEISSDVNKKKALWLSLKRVFNV